jgi:hypothetical protein
MKISGCWAALARWIAPTALALSVSPALAAGDDGSRALLCHRLGLASSFSSAAGLAAPARLDVRPDRPLPALETVIAGPVEERACSLQTLSEPELLAPPPASAPFLALGHGPSALYLSLGGPALTLTSPDALPRLRDPAAAPPDPEDTLRFIRSHW